MTAASLANCAIADMVTSPRAPPAPTQTGSTPCAPQTPAPLRQKKRRLRIYRPERDSLYDILHEHTGTPLFLPPNKWTDLHMELLGVRWQELLPCDKPRPIAFPNALPSRGHLNPSPTIELLCDHLTQIQQNSPHSNRLVVIGAIKTVLETIWPNTFREPYRSIGLGLHVGSRFYPDVVTAELMWNLTSDAISSQSSLISSPNRPRMICYVDIARIASSRNNNARKSGLQGTLNEPVARPNQLKARKPVPPNPSCDPCLAGIFLAMAQRHLYTHLSATGMGNRHLDHRKRIPSSILEDVQLQILTHDTATSAFIVYTAYMTKEFLQRFHHPFKAPPDNNGATVSGFRIEYTSVPVWPVLGLRERMGKAFGQHTVGSFNADGMETWMGAPEEPKNGRGKRKVAKSSDGDDAANEPVLVAKKRRLNGEMST